MAHKSLCKIPDCNKPSRSQGWCNVHYQRFYRLGDPLADVRSKTPNGTLLKFLRGVAAHPPSHCVVWPFWKSRGGYGMVTFRGRKTTAHRVAWELYHDREMRPDMQAAHQPVVCHSRDCVNPLHVREATVADNHADKVADDTHLRGERQWLSRLTRDQVREIRKDGRVHREIACDFEISETTISQIKGGQRWGWLDNEC